MGKRKAVVPKGQARLIGQRLRDFVGRRYDSVADFGRKLEIRRNTLSGWLHPTDPSVPDVPSLIKLATVAEMDLHWLLLGEEGADLRMELLREETPEEEVSRILKSEVRAKVNATSEEFDTAWNYLRISPGGSWREPRVLALAVQAIKQALEVNLQMARHYAGLAELANEHERMFYKMAQLNPKKAKEAEEKARELYGPSWADRMKEHIDRANEAPSKTRGKHAKRKKKR